LQTYELGLTRIGKESKSKSIELKAKRNEINESSDDEDLKMKSYITRQFKKLMKNANVKGFDKGCKQSSLSLFKNQDRGMKDVRDGGQYTILFGPKCFRCQGFGHMKQECPIYLKSAGKGKSLVALDDEGILNAFTVIVDPIEGVTKTVDDEEDLMDSKFDKIDNQDDIHTTYAKLYKVFEKYEKLYWLATKKLSDVELDREELSTKVDEANQTIGELQFEKNFLAKRTKKFEAKLFQVRAQLERTSSAKLDEKLSF